MADPVLTPELLAAYREVVAASDADAKLPPHKRSNRLGDALANVYGIVGSASLIVHLADEVARLTRERDEAATKERAAVVAHLEALSSSVGDDEAFNVLVEAATDITLGEHVKEVAGG